MFHSRLFNLLPHNPAIDNLPGEPLAHLYGPSNVPLEALQPSSPQSGNRQFAEKFRCRHRLWVSATQYFQAMSLCWRKAFGSALRAWAATGRVTWEVAIDLSFEKSTRSYLLIYAPTSLDFFTLLTFSPISGSTSRFFSGFFSFGATKASALSFCLCSVLSFCRSSLSCFSARTLLA